METVIIIIIASMGGLGIIITLLFLAMNKITEQHSLDDEEYGKPTGYNYSDSCVLVVRSKKQKIGGKNVRRN